LEEVVDVVEGDAATERRNRKYTSPEEREPSEREIIIAPDFYLVKYKIFKRNLLIS
jgi:hypothetical protein